RSDRRPGGAGGTAAHRPRPVELRRRPGMLLVPLPAPHWPHGPGEFRLADDEVHVWCAVLERPTQEMDRLAELLSDDERQRVERPRTPAVRRELPASRALLRTLLGRYLGCAPRRVRFRSGPQGKPELVDCPWHRPLHFNVTHSYGLA